ncbi:hypothetical protein LguiB_003959 [Lonicera macranthoides]
MGTYFHGNSEIQGGSGGSGGDGNLQTLILMNPGYVGYSSDTQSPPQPNNNFFFLNPTTLNPPNISHAPPPSSHTHQLVGIPLSAPSSQDPQSIHEIPSLQSYATPRIQYTYNPANLAAARNLTAAREATRSQQGLSLTLSSQQTGYGAYREAPAPAVQVAGVRSPSSASGISTANGMQSLIVSSKYLKAAQDLLEEVVNVEKGVKLNESVKLKSGSKVAEGSPAAPDGEGGSGGETKKAGSEITTAERQEIQMKKAKLVNMLDEVEQRYRQYHSQMQIVISWFEQAAGIGSAKTYTALALQTISKQFRCLKDAILGQIRIASKSLGEEDCLAAGKMGGSSRLKFVDNQIRQQRALQQLGMIQHNAWRPQRGLPERSVSVLRAWLFEHFLHPYPKDSDKHMLAKQTGLTRSQVSNWFINARVRLWKPMVEEMYVEEIKENEQNGSEEKTTKSDQNEDSTSKSNTPNEKIEISPQENENQNRGFISKRENPSNQNTPISISTSTVSTSPTGLNLRNPSTFSLIRSPEIDRYPQENSKKQRSEEMLQSPVDHRQNHDRFTLMGGPGPTNFMGGLGSYPIGEIGRYNGDQFGAPFAGNGVSLTLGLPHCENISMSGTRHNFLGNQTVQMGRGMNIGETNEFSAMNTPASSHSAAMYENINIQNRKSFAAQLLPDFVA